MDNASFSEIVGTLLNVAALILWILNLRWVWPLWRAAINPIRLLLLIVVLLLCGAAFTALVFLAVDGIYFFIPPGARVEIQLGQAVSILGISAIDILDIVLGGTIYILRRQFRRLFKRGQRPVAATKEAGTSTGQPRGDDGLPK